MSSRLFLIALLASVLAFLFISVEAKESRASRAILNKRKGSSSSSSSGQFSGVATWFIPSTEGGSMGACGSFEADDAIIVALNAVQYGSMSSKSQYCGRTVRISYNGKTVDAVVNDACPECQFGDLDLTQIVFSKLGNLNTGVLDVTWKFL